MNADKEPRGPLDDGWDALAQAWQQIAPPRLEHAPAALQRRVRLVDLRFRLLAVLEVLSYLAMIVLLVTYLRQHKGTASFLWGFMMMWFVAWGLDFAISIRKGLWQAADATTAAWLDLLAERCRRKRRYARTSWQMLGVMYLAMGAMVIGFYFWLPKDFERIAGGAAEFAGILLGLLGFQWLWSHWYLGKVAAEEREIAALRGEDPPTA